MKNKTITFITAAALALAIPLYAADYPVKKSDSQQQTGLTQQQYGQMQYGQSITANELQGMEVVSQEGRKIGEIEKVTIDEQSGEVQFVIFSKDGILGMGKDQVAAPLSAFEIRNDQARLNVDESRLRNVPQQNAEATDRNYRRDLESHYGIAPAWDKGEDLSDSPDYETLQNNNASDAPRNMGGQY